MRAWWLQGASAPKRWAKGKAILRCPQESSPFSPTSLLEKWWEVNNTKQIKQYFYHNKLTAESEIFGKKNCHGKSGWKSVITVSWRTLTSPGPVAARWSNCGSWSWQPACGAWKNERSFGSQKVCWTDQVRSKYLDISSGSHELQWNSPSCWYVAMSIAPSPPNNTIFKGGIPTIPTIKNLGGLLIIATYPQFFHLSNPQPVSTQLSPGSLGLVHLQTCNGTGTWAKFRFHGRNHRETIGKW